MFYDGEKSNELLTWPQELFSPLASYEIPFCTHINIYRVCWKQLAFVTLVPTAMRKVLAAE